MSNVVTNGNVSNNTSSSTAPTNTNTNVKVDSKEVNKDVKNQETKTTEVKKEETAQETKQQEAAKRKIKLAEDLEADEEEVIKRYKRWEEAESKIKDADKKYQEVAKTKKEREAFEKSFYENPGKFLNDYKVPKEVRQHFKNKLEEALLESYNEEELSPEMQKLKEYERKEKEEEELKKQQEEAKYQAEVQEQINNLGNKIKEILEKHDLPKNYSTIKEIGMFLKECWNEGVDVTEDDVVEYYNEQMDTSFKEIYSKKATKDIKSLYNLLGEDTIKLIREYDISLLKTKDEEETKKKETRSTPSKEETPRFSTIREFQEWQRKQGLIK